jgi:hypothetical protein
VYRCKEYTAAKNLNEAIIVAEIKDFAIILVKRKISPTKFIVGGAAIFVIENKSHQIDNDGEIVSSPFVKNILRVFVWSYVELAREKSAEEHNP